MHSLITPYLAYLRDCRAGLAVMVRLGSPEFADCRSLGICELFIDDHLPAGPCRSTCVPAYLRLDAPTGRLLLHFEDRAITPEVRRRHFPPGGFTLLHPYRLPPRLAEHLHLECRHYQLGAGTYPLLDDGTFTTLSLRLTLRDRISLGRAA